MKIVLLLLFWLSLASAQFSRGLKFQYVNLVGVLSIACPIKTVQTVCYATHMEPWAYDRIRGPKIPQAIKVQILAYVDASPDFRKVIVDYDGRTGSSDEINLGVSSLFQTPLLRVGNNKIIFTLLNKRGDHLINSEFYVVVNRESPRTCQAQTIITGLNLDCELPYSSCQQQFKDQNYCKQSQ